MSVLMTIQNEQNTQKLNMKHIESKVLEMYNDCDDAEYDEQDEFFYDVMIITTMLNLGKKLTKMLKWRTSLQINVEKLMTIAMKPLHVSLVL
jgi:hypothetical protein